MLFTIFRDTICQFGREREHASEHDWRREKREEMKSGTLLCPEYSPVSEVRREQTDAQYILKHSTSLAEEPLFAD